MQNFKNYILTVCIVRNQRLRSLLSQEFYQKKVRLRGSGKVPCDVWDVINQDYLDIYQCLQILTGFGSLTTHYAARNR